MASSADEGLEHVWDIGFLPDGRAATRVADPLLGGLPLKSSGRHSGCRTTLGPDGALYVGTGDTANPAVPQDRTQLGGKVLRLDLATGGPAPGNPFAAAADPAERLVFTYGHRNVQGVTVQPGTGRLFAAEHGPDVDDEINLLRAGANYGWDPSRGGAEDSYDESVPMTDLARFPDAVPPVWSSGGSTEAICGAAVLEGPQWGSRQGLLAVAALKGSKLLLMRLDPQGTVIQVGQLPALNGTHGRPRAARPARTAPSTSPPATARTTRCSGSTQHSRHPLVGQAGTCCHGNSGSAGDARSRWGQSSTLYWTGCLPVNH